MALNETWMQEKLPEKRTAALYRQIRQAVMQDLTASKEADEECLAQLIDAAITRAAAENILSLREKIQLRSELLNRFRGLDFLQELLEDRQITEIMINGPAHIFVERQGKMECLARCFESTEQLMNMIQKIVSRINRSVNTALPIADARLEDGSRVHIVLPPVALDGPVMTIRKFPETIDMERLIAYKTISRGAAEYLGALVRAGYNLMISGGTSSGKSTFLNALTAYIPTKERVISIEDAAELNISHIPNLVRLETRNKGMEGNGEISMSMLIKASLRMRPDRIIVGEVRGAEAQDMLQAMNTGHDGSLSTGHANSAKDMLARLEAMVLSGVEVPLQAIRSQIASALDLIVHLGRMPDGRRTVLEITEVCGIEAGEIKLKPLFLYQPEERKLIQVGKLKNRDKLLRRGILLRDSPGTVRTKSERSD